MDVNVDQIVLVVLEKEKLVQILNVLVDQIVNVKEFANVLNKNI